MHKVVGIFADRWTPEYLSELSEDERGEVLCECLGEGVAPSIRAVLHAGPTENCLLAAKPVVERSLFDVVRALGMDLFVVAGVMDEVRGSIVWEHARRRGIRRVIVMVDADPIAMAAAATWIAGISTDCEVDVRWPMATMLTEGAPQSALISLAGWEKRVVQSLAEHELATLGAQGWGSIVELWQRGYKVEVDAFVLWHEAWVERVLRDACQR
ncbi:MAG: hypothetical protein U0269_17455 [Polyangiales bacterium]